MKKLNHTVNGEHGMHARPAGKLVNFTKNFISRITVKKLINNENNNSSKDDNDYDNNGDDNFADLKGLFSLMSLNISKGDSVQIQIEGPDEDEAYLKLSDFIKEF